MGKEIKEIRNWGERELAKNLQEKGEELRKIRFSNDQGRLKRHHVLKKNRRTISRILTVLKEKNTK